MDGLKRILVVDDEMQTRELFASMLDSFGYSAEVARDGIEALAKLSLDIDLVLLDAIMPVLDGFEVVRRIREGTIYNDIPIVMVTGLASKEDRLRAAEVGANDFIVKPVDMTELRIRTASLLKMKEAQDAIKRHKAELEERVERKTAALRLALDEMAEAKRAIHQAYMDTIHRLALVAEFKDMDTAAHVQRMSGYCAILARALDLPSRQVDTILKASTMHDVGKIGIPDAILLKPGKLTDKEWEIMKQHTVIGARILSGSSSELLQMGEVIALSHHEKWDGSGYPNGLAGENIPLVGRICAVADVFDALTSVRPYKKAFSNEESLKIMREARGLHFDPHIFDLFIENFDRVLTIQKEHRADCLGRGMVGTTCENTSSETT